MAVTCCDAGHCNLRRSEQNNSSSMKKEKKEMHVERHFLTPNL